MDLATLGVDSEQSCSQAEGAASTTIKVHEAASADTLQNDRLDAVAALAFEHSRRRCAKATPHSAAPKARPLWARLAFQGEVARPPAGKPVLRARRGAYQDRGFAGTTWRSTLAGKKKTTFAKLNREAKVREKRQARSMRKEQRERERDAGVQIEDQVEDLSHLDVAVVAGVEPDVTVKR